MKSSIVFSILLIAASANALYIPAGADASMDRRDEIIRRGKDGKGPTVRPVVPTAEEKRKAANDKFQEMKSHVLHGKDAKGKDEAPDKGRHALTAYCKANPKATGQCNTKTNLCHVPDANKSLWDDRPGKHTLQQIENHCTDAILNHTKNPTNKAHVVKTDAGHHICVKYISGENNGGTGTCYHAGVNVPEGGLAGDTCDHTGNTAIDKADRADFKCSAL
uniref:Uncharacterized protein n=1 Tax=Psilocybe cubensis TaxID=181762 RepID=A0A8H8CEE2_PSICU